MCFGWLQRIDRRLGVKIWIYRRILAWWKDNQIKVSVRHFFCSITYLDLLRILSQSLKKWNPHSHRLGEAFGSCPSKDEVFEVPRGWLPWLIEQERHMLVEIKGSNRSQSSLLSWISSYSVQRAMESRCGSSELMLRSLEEVIGPWSR